MIAQILKDVQIRVVPEHDEHRFLHPLHVRHNQIDYILKVSTESVQIEGTYFLPSGNR